MENVTVEPPPDLASFRGPLPWLKELFVRFGRDNCPAWAAALSFFSLLSIPSLLLCGLAVLGFLIRSPQQAAQETERAIARVLPGAGARESAHSIIQQLNVEKSAAEIQDRRGVTGLVGIALLFWSAIQIFVNAATPMNAAFRAHETRNWFQLRIRALGMLVGAGLLFMLSLLPAAGVQVLNSLPGLGNLPDPSPFWLDLILALVGVAINAAMFTFIYRFLPSPDAGVDWKEAAFGGVVAAVLWEVAKQAFALYLQRFGGSAGYDKVYGSFGGLVLLTFWIYYTSMLLLLGAEAAKLYSDYRDARQAKAKAGEGSGAAEATTDARQNATGAAG